MKVRIAAVGSLILIVMMTGVFAVHAQDSPPLFVEEGTPLVEPLSYKTTSQESSAVGYKITTSENDPSCDTGFGGYVDLQQHGISVTARVPGGDNFAAGPFFTSVGSIDFYGQKYQSLYLTDDGFVIFDQSHYGNRPWEPQILPDTFGPNGLAAMLWQNMRIVYDKAANHGVSLGAAADGSVMVVEFDNIRLANAPSHQYDIEMVMRPKVSDAPGHYEIVFAYDNLNGSLDGPLTIGVENETGSSGVAFLNKESARWTLSDGFMVCLDADSGAPPSGTPSSIRASDGIYEDKVQVTWSDVNLAVSYDVYRADENGNSEIKLGTADDTLYNDVSASAGITYTYSVKACNEYGCSSPSAPDTGWRAGDDPPPPPPLVKSNFLPLFLRR